MYLSRFGVKHYKCLGEIDIPLTPIHVIIGENDAGKTSLLEAMRALHACSEMPLDGVFPKPWEGTELVSHARPVSEIELSAEWRHREGEQSGDHQCLQYEIGLRFGDSKPQDCRRIQESFGIDGLSKDTVVGRSVPYSLTTLHASTLPEHAGRIGFDSSVLGKFAQVVKTTDIYRFNSRVMRLPATSDPKLRFRLDSDGFRLSTMLQDTIGHDVELAVHLQREFRRLFPQFKKIQVRSEPGLTRSEDQYGNSIFQGAAIGAAIYFEMTSGGVVRADQVSDGAILLLGFLALAYLPDPPKLLLIEEPENGIYPKRLGEVIGMLKELVSRTDGVRFPQIILTTHSPYVLSFFEPKEVTFLSRPPDDPSGPVRGRPLREAPNIEERLGSEFYLGELWYNLSEEELFGEP